jgi:hypothetical protein
VSQETKSGTAPETKVEGKSNGQKNARAGGTNQDSDDGSSNEQNEKQGCQIKSSKFRNKSERAIFEN